MDESSREALEYAQHILDTLHNDLGEELKRCNVRSQRILLEMFRNDALNAHQHIQDVLGMNDAPPQVDLAFEEPDFVEELERKRARKSHSDF